MPYWFIRFDWVGLMVIQSKNSSFAIFMRPIQSRLHNISSNNSIFYIRNNLKSDWDVHARVSHNCWPMESRCGGARLLGGQNNGGRWISAEPGPCTCACTLCVRYPVVWAAYNIIDITQRPVDMAALWRNKCHVFCAYVSDSGGKVLLCPLVWQI